MRRAEANEVDGDTADVLDIEQRRWQAVIPVGRQVPRMTSRAVGREATSRDDRIDGDGQCACGRTSVDAIQMDVWMRSWPKIDRWAQKWVRRAPVPLRFVSGYVSYTTGAPKAHGRGANVYLVSTPAYRDVDRWR